MSDQPEPMDRLLEIARALQAEISRMGPLAEQRAIHNGLERVARETAAAILTAYPCSCAPDYTERGMTSPDCFRCVALAAGEEVALGPLGAGLREEPEP